MRWKRHVEKLLKVANAEVILMKYLGDGLLMQTLPSLFCPHADKLTTPQRILVAVHLIQSPAVSHSISSFVLSVTQLLWPSTCDTVTFLSVLQLRTLATSNNISKEIIIQFKVHPASYPIGTGVLSPGVKRGRYVTLTTHPI
jgi:hypothetical protein